MIKDMNSIDIRKIEITVLYFILAYNYVLMHNTVPFANPTIT